MTFTPAPTSSYSEIWLSTDDSTYYLCGTDVDGDIYIAGLGVFYDTGDTVYVKIVAVSSIGVKTELPTAAMDSVAIPTTGALTKLASFYAGLYDLWGGNSSLSNAATKIVLGNLNGTPKIAIGTGTADSMSISNAATYPGFFADGNGYMRSGNGTYGMVLDGSGLDILGDVNADHFIQNNSIITNHVADNNITRDWSDTFEDYISITQSTWTPILSTLSFTPINKPLLIFFYFNFNFNDLTNVDDLAMATRIRRGSSTIKQFNYIYISGYMGGTGDNIYYSFYSGHWIDSAPGNILTTISMEVYWYLRRGSTVDPLWITQGNLAVLEVRK